MELEDILKIDTEPFDAEFIDTLCGQEGYGIPLRIKEIYGSLVLRYFQRFSMENSLPKLGRATCDIPISIGVEVEEIGDEWYIWYEESNNLMDSAMNSMGWESIWLYLDETLTDAYGWNEDRKELEKSFPSDLLAWLDKLNLSKEEKNFCLNEHDIFLDAIFGLEEGYILGFHNSKLSAYLQIREKNRELIERLCKREDEEIRKLERDIWEPIYVYFDHETGEKDDIHYGIYSLGHDGYSYCNWENFNPNWMCKAFVLNELLDLSLGKLECYFNQPEQVA